MDNSNMTFEVFTHNYSDGDKFRHNNPSSDTYIKGHIYNTNIITLTSLTDGLVLTIKGNRDVYSLIEVIETTT